MCSLQRTTTFKLVNSMDDIQDLAAGTTCTSTAAALPPLGDREGQKKQCYDLTAVQFSEEVGCTIIGKDTTDCTRMLSVYNFIPHLVSVYSVRP